jgi:hypothetical protein
MESGELSGLVSENSQLLIPFGRHLSKRSYSRLALAPQLTAKWWEIKIQHDLLGAVKLS